jgi:TonB family protein
VAINSHFVSIRARPQQGFGSGASRMGGTLEIGQLVSSVAPFYPTDAARQRIEGSVKLRTLVGANGSVQSVQVLSGPPALVPAATAAVREWRYAPTLLGGQPVESEHEATLVFRLSAGTSASR